MKKVHYLKRDQRETACGRKAKSTFRDTRIKARVTCKTCQKVLASWGK